MGLIDNVHQTFDYWREKFPYEGGVFIYFL